MKTPSLFLILTFLALCACEIHNPWMEEVLEPKTVTFDSNGGSFVPSQKLYKGQAVERPDDPTKDGFIFAGWHTQNGLEYDFAFVPVKDMTLYAWWRDIDVSIPTEPTDPTDPIGPMDYFSTPTESDFYIVGTGTFDFDGNSKTVTVTPKEGKTAGTITVRYENETGGAKTTTPPSQPGTYKVTFDVEEAGGWNAVNGLSAGQLIIKITKDGFANYLNSLTVSSSPLTIKLNISDAEDFENIKNALMSAPDKRVILDLSESTINTIPPAAFGDGSGSTKNESLVGIIMPNTVTNIGSGAFINCINLKNVTIPGSVEVIGSNAFTGCASLTSVIIPDSVTTINGGAFSHCTSLTSINIPNNVTIIGMMAFQGCENLKYINIPSGVTAIGEYTFAGCSKLENIIIPSGVTSIDKNAFAGCQSLKNITIPNGVTAIMEYTFYGCTSLETITIPAGVSSIDESAFASCNNLNKVIFEGAIPQGNFANNAFPGDLYSKYYGNNGGAGTYIATYSSTNPNGPTWSKE